jgi:hypothetical protein
MFDKLSQFAEQAATNVSRRQFLGRFAGSAMLLAGAVGALLALPSAAEAGVGPPCCCAIRACYRRDDRQRPCIDGYTPCKCTRYCD